MMAAGLLPVLHDPVVTAAVMVLMAALFAPAAWHKLIHRENFLSTLMAYKLLPERGLMLAGSVLAVLEALVPLALILPATRSFAMLLAAGLLLAYALAIAVNLVRGRSHIDCGCGDESQPLSWALVLRNALLAALASICSSPVTERALDGLDLAAGLLTSAGFYGLYRVAEELIRQSGRLRTLKERM